MTSEEMITVFDEKIAELEAFFMIAQNPEEDYEHSMRLCDAMKLACNLVRNCSAEKQAAFRLGQMDMRMSAADALRKQAEFTKGICRSTMLADADIVESLGVI